MPSTLGCGLALFTNIVVAGSANVRPVTWMKRTAQSATQTKRPSFSAGGGVREGIMERNGTRIYAIGKQ